MADENVLDQFERIAAEASGESLDEFFEEVKRRIVDLQGSDDAAASVVVIIGGRDALMSSLWNVSDAEAVYLVEVFKDNLITHRGHSHE